MLTVSCFKWEPKNPYRSSFTSEHVNVLASMVFRHYPHPHRFVCITDKAEGLDTGLVQPLELWTEFASVPAPQGNRNPSCYRRLKLFDTSMEKLLGPRFVCMDLDAVVTGDLTPLWDRPEPLVLLQGTNPTTHYNGSMQLQQAGIVPEVWTTFDPTRSPAITRDAGIFGSDQAWISYCLGKGVPTWSTEDGVYSYRTNLDELRFDKIDRKIRLVFFQGQNDPWSEQPQRLEWVRNNWK